MSSTKTLYEWQLIISNLVAEHGPNATIAFTAEGYTVTPVDKESSYPTLNGFNGMSKEDFKQYIINERCC